MRPNLIGALLLALSAFILTAFTVAAVGLLLANGNDNYRRRLADNYLVDDWGSH